MLVLCCDNRMDRGQLLRLQRPLPRVDMRSLLPHGRWANMYRQDGMAALLGTDARVLDVGEADTLTQAPQALDGERCVVIDHEALHEAFALFWETPAIAAGIGKVLADGGMLWIGFQSHSYLPAWLVDLLPGDAPVVAAGEADSVVPAIQHDLTAELPESVDFICHRSWRALRDMPSTEPLDLTPQPSERGSLAWRRLGDDWQCLAHRRGHPEQVALAIAEVAGGKVVLDQTLALFGANIDSAPARRFAAAIRRFLGVERDEVAPAHTGSIWRCLRGELPPDHAPRELVQAAGIPFAVNANESLLPVTGNQSELPVGGVVRRLHLLGNILSFPMATGAWFTDAMDFSEDLFVGDDVGCLALEYADGTRDVVPLIMGWTIFWQPELLGLHSMKPFDDPAARTTLFDTMALARGAGEGVRSWVLSLTPQPKPMVRLVIEGRADRPGVPIYGAVTVETDDPDLGTPLPPPTGKPAARPLAPPFTMPEGHLQPIQRLLYTYPEDFAAAPLELPATFEGAQVRFSGPQEAAAWTCIYAHNLASMGERLHPSGGGCSLNSGRVYGTYRMSLGTWKDGRCDLTGPVSFWSRDNGRAGIERLGLGLHTGVDKELALWDLLLYTAHPPHTRRAAREMIGPAQWHRPTLTGHCIHVAPENDGHGLLMLYHAAYLRHYPERLASLWPAMIDYADWVCFLLDNPVDPQQPSDTLYTDSECSGYGHWDIYSNWLCLAGLEAYAEFAAQSGRVIEADRWQAAAKRLRNGIRGGLVDDLEGRRIWHASPFSQWQSLTEALTPLFTLPDLRSYDVAGTDPEELAIHRDTYARLVDHPHYHLRTRMIGYDHALLLQSALLLDDGPRATKLLNTLARAIYDVHAEETWIVAEGAVIPTHEGFWHRLGMSANTIHVAETLKVVRLMLGLDDLSAGRLKVMPRLPMGWEGAEVSGYPLVGGIQADYVYRLSPRDAHLRLRLDASRRVDARLGPFAAAPAHATVNARDWPIEQVKTPAGYWGWLRDIEGREVDIHANVT